MQDVCAIAIIDDEISVRVGLRRLLEVFGLRTTVHASGVEFVAWLEAGAPRPDCLLLDAHMPDLSGVEVARHLVRNGIYIPTIIFTADDSAEAFVRDRANGIVASLRKPVSSDDLLAAVERALNRKASL
jgi:FixJ family two-component response regulator